MGELSGISWTHGTANFWMGCCKVSNGCKNCYAETFVTKRMSLPVWGPAKTTDRKLAKGVWKDVPKWNRTAADKGTRMRVFVSSLSDIFEDHPQLVPWRAKALALLEKCTSLDVLLLTKRPENIPWMVPPAWLENWPEHIWVGTTVEDKEQAGKRLPFLKAVPAKVRFLSCEPLLEDLGELDLWGIHWVIVGGESGPDARSFDIAWARNILSRCVEAGVARFMKQVGKVPYLEGVKLTLADSTHGGDPEEWPLDIQVREFPTA